MSCICRTVVIWFKMLWTKPFFRNRSLRRYSRKIYPLFAEKRLFKRIWKLMDAHRRINIGSIFTALYCTKPNHTALKNNSKKITKSTALRIIYFNMDLFWPASTDYRPTSLLEIIHETHVQLQTPYSLLLTPLTQMLIPWIEVFLKEQSGPCMDEMLGNSVVIGLL